MSDGPEWFAPKRYGYGSGLPIAWQGWVALLAYLAIVIGASIRLAGAPIALLGIIVPATALFILVTAKTTKGGWRWRWGPDDRP